MDPTNYNTEQSNMPNERFMPSTLEHERERVTSHYRETNKISWRKQDLISAKNTQPGAILSPRVINNGQ